MTIAPHDWFFDGWPFDVFEECALKNYENINNGNLDAWAEYCISGYVLGVSLHRRKLSPKGNGIEDWTNLHVLFADAPLDPREPLPLFHERWGQGMRALYTNTFSPKRYARHLHMLASADMSACHQRSEPQAANQIISAWRKQNKITLTGHLRPVAVAADEAGRRKTFVDFETGLDNCPSGIVREVSGANLLNPVALACWRARLRARAPFEHERWNWARLTPADRLTIPRTA